MEMIGDQPIDEIAGFTAQMPALDELKFAFPQENPYIMARYVWRSGLHRADKAIGWGDLSEGGADAVEFRDACWAWRLEIERKVAAAEAKSKRKGR